MEKTWKVLGSFNGDLLESLLESRGLADQKEAFLSPPPLEKSIKQIDWPIDKAVKLIRSHIDKGSDIFIHGDYDVDGICATAILYKTLREDLGHKNCYYFIPSRFEDGYGLSLSSVEKLKSGSKSKLLITVDCGVTSVSECEAVKKKGFDVIISDHHTKPAKLPKPDVLLWTDRLTGSGIALALSLEIAGPKDDYLALAALATVADVQPVLDLNRSVVKYGLPKFGNVTLPGLARLIEASGIAGKRLTTYELGWILSPRLNAAGRLESAIDSLKLLLTSDCNEALQLASKLNKINLERQKATAEMVERARAGDFSGKKVLIAAHQTFHEGVVGLVAGKLVSEFFRPAIAISVGKDFSKGSARSVEGVDLIKMLRSLDGVYENIGGHPMAAGFTIKTSRLEEFKLRLEELAESFVQDIFIQPSLKIDLELPLNVVSFPSAKKISLMEPFGMGNPEPIFVSRGARVLDARRVGSTGSHLKLRISESSYGKPLDAIYFGGGNSLENVGEGLVDLAYSFKEGFFGGYPTLELHVKDLRPL